MKTPTEQAMRAAEVIHPYIVKFARHDAESAKFLQRVAASIDTATNLPALLAERDALRAALAGLVKSISDAPPEWFTDECLGIDTEQAYAALALGQKG